MWTKTTLAAAALLALAGCDRPAEEHGEILEEPGVEERGAYGQAVDTVAPAEELPAVGRTDCVDPTNPACTTEPRPEAMQDVEVTEEEAAAASAPGAAANPHPPTLHPSTPGEPVDPDALSTVTSQADLDATTSGIAAALRGAGLEVLATAQYGAGDRVVAGDAPSAAELEGETGRVAAPEIGQARMIVFRSANAERRAVSERGIDALFEAPRMVAVFERGDEVVVAWRRPAPDAENDAGEPLGPELDRLIAEAVTDRSEAGERAGAAPAGPTRG